jgi:hypothetical protein
VPVWVHPAICYTLTMVAILLLNTVFLAFTLLWFLQPEIFGRTDIVLILAVIFFCWPIYLIFSVIFSTINLKKPLGLVTMLISLVLLVILGFLFFKLIGTVQSGN